MLRKVWWEVTMGVMLAAAGLFTAERLLENGLKLEGSFGEVVMGFAAMVIMLVATNFITSETQLCVMWPSFKSWRFMLEVPSHVQLLRRLKFDLPGFVACVGWLLGADVYTSYCLAGTKYWYLAIGLHVIELVFVVVLAQWWRRESERLGFTLSAAERGRQRLVAGAEATAETGDPPVRA